jgi:anaerobic carbon-monoxide dehydrogenase, CODH/ACS complex subunit alpha
VRVPADIPLTMKDEILEHLKQHDWKETSIPDPTLLPRMIHTRKE